MSTRKRDGRTAAPPVGGAGPESGVEDGPTVDEVIDAVRRENVPDFRSGVFDVHAVDGDGVVVLRGQVTHDSAMADLIARLSARGIDAIDEVLRLPDSAFGEFRHALVRSAIAPVYSDPRLPGTQISQLVLGMRVELLSQSKDWLRIRGEDGYHGWVHGGYLQAGTQDWALAWERGSTGEPVVSLGAELADEDGRILARLPWGARLIRHTGAYQLPDGRRGQIVYGEVVDVDRLADWFPARGDSIARTARRWLGAPYVWGGVTLQGVDCSGFTQAVMWMHGIALPRDSDMQATRPVGVQVDPLAGDLRAGDLVFFAEEGERISHVAIALGGSLIIHSALTNGGVDTNDLAGELPFEQRLRRMMVRATRVLPD
jgi:gamma-D-glutamyl-L-lysine dipeptidyl-peptidase